MLIVARVFRFHLVLSAQFNIYTVNVPSPFEWTFLVHLLLFSYCFFLFVLVLSLSLVLSQSMHHRLSVRLVY